MKSVVLSTLVLLCFMAQGQVRPSYWWQCQEGKMLINHHPAVFQNGENPLVGQEVDFSDSYTVVAVFRDNNRSTDNEIWELIFGDGSERRMGTKTIGLGSSSIRYQGQIGSGPTINTLQQGVSLKNVEDQTCRLVVGSNVQDPNAIAMAELLYFDRRLNIVELLMVQSALAVKYGVTLGPTNYVDGNGNTVWDYEQNRDFHNRVFGLGKDQAYDLNQLKSHSECDGGVLSVSTASLDEGEWLLLGDNNKAFSFEKGKGNEVEFLSREWIACPNDAVLEQGRKFDLTLDLTNLKGGKNNLALVVDGTVYAAEKVSGNVAVFKGVIFDSSRSRVRVARGVKSKDMHMASEDGSEETVDLASHSSTRLYPNPSNGRYSVEVTNAEWVKVTIHNTLGEEVAQFEKSGDPNCTFEGTLPTGNIYYVTIATNDGVQTTKLVVR